ncbi:MAG TPA: fibronectin type III domain-containing protein [Candidatus Cloacimonadota bacterium]|nr:fibronectin type III domain-containing protein [Candidatus Cloacimonadota bacterium]
MTNNDILILRQFQNRRLMISPGRGGLVKPNGSPSNLALTVDSDTAISGSFTIGSTNQAGHYAYYSTDQVTWTKATNAEAVMTGSDNTFQITGLTQASLYYVRVCAYKGSQLSAYCAIKKAVSYATGLTDAGAKFSFLFDHTNLITKDGSNLISQIASIIGTDTLAEATNKPTYDITGIKFGGTSLLSVATLTNGWTLPVSVYAIIKINSFYSSDIIFAGRFDELKLEQWDVSPKLRFRNTTPVGYVSPTLNAYHVVSLRVNADGTFSLQFDNDTPLTGNGGISNPIGFSIGARLGGFGKSDIDVLDIHLRSDADVAKGALIKQYMQNRLAFFLT